MYQVNDDEFNTIIAGAIKQLSPDHIAAVQNVAILWDDEPTFEQRQELNLRHDQTLFGLYQGVSRVRRNGRTDYPPDKITIFRGPISRSVNTLAELKEQVKHTLWHELAHYFGLDHPKIQELEH